MLPGRYRRSEATAATKPLLLPASPAEKTKQSADEQKNNTARFRHRGDAEAVETLFSKRTRLLQDIADRAECRQAVDRTVPSAPTQRGHVTRFYFEPLPNISALIQGTVRAEAVLVRSRLRP